jgi:hypothetical protein
VSMNDFGSEIQISDSKSEYGCFAATYFHFDLVARWGVRYESFLENWCDLVTWEASDEYQNWKRQNEQTLPSVQADSAVQR